MSNILFLCTGNTCRSQMAEGYINALYSKTHKAHSAGVEAQKEVNPFAVQVMKEDGINISGNKPKTVDALHEINFDYVVTVCDHANETCPVFPGHAKRIHQSFPDPPSIIQEQGLQGEAALQVYRDVRDQIKAFVQTLLQTLDSNKEQPNATCSHQFTS